MLQVEIQVALLPFSEFGRGKTELDESHRARIIEIQKPSYVPSLNRQRNQTILDSLAARMLQPNAW